MTRKRFIKLSMAQVDRNTADFAALIALTQYGCYEDAFIDWDGIIKGRFEIYLSKCK